MTKQCYKCKQIKDDDKFNRNKSTKDGLSYECKKCKSEYRKNNKTKINEYNKSRRQYNKNNGIVYKYLSSPKTKIIARLRHRLSYIKYRYNLVDVKPITELLGCDGTALLEHLQQTAISNGYSDFDINDYDSDEYHIDHIIPYSSICDGECIENICHYTNLQILTKAENLAKSG